VTVPLSRTVDVPLTGRIGWMLLVALFLVLPAAVAVAQPTAVEAAQQVVGAAGGRATEAARRARVAQEGRVFGPVSIECRLAQCADPSFLASLHDVVAIQEGDAYDADRIRSAVERLSQTTFFSSVETSTRLQSDGSVTLTFLTEPAVLIRRMRVRSGFALETEVRRRIFLRSGQPWSGSLSVLTRQENAILEYFEGEGFFEGTVRIRPDGVGDGTIDLRIDVDRGRRLAVGNIYVRGNELLRWDEIRTTLLGEFNLLRTFTTRNFDAAQQALLLYYRELGRLQARITLDVARLGPGGDTVDLFLEVREGPPWRIEFTGNTVLSRSELLETLTFWRTGFIDEEELRLAVDQLRSRYETAGRYFVDIQVSQRTDADGVSILQFEIDEAGVSEVREVRFEGVHSLPHDTVRRALATTVYDVFQVGGYLQRSALASDVERIRDLYRSEGFLSAEVTQVSVIASDAGRALYVTFHVVEGPQTLVDRVDMDLPDDVPGLRLQVRAGRPFSPQALDEDMGTIRRVWTERGHAFATLETMCHFDGIWQPCVVPTRPAECRLRPDRDRRTACGSVWRAGMYVEECVLLVASPSCAPSPGLTGPSVAIRHAVAPGGLVRFGHVFLRGNFRTRDWVLLDDLPFRPGDPFDLNRLLVGQSNIRSQGIFDSVRVQQMVRHPEGAAENVADLVIQVEESRAQFVDLRTGMEARLPSTGNFLLIFSNEPGYRHGNFLGRGEELRLLGNLDFDVIDRDRVARGEFRGGAQVVYTDRRFRGWWLKRSEPLEARTLLGYRYDLLAIAPSPQVRTIEFESRIRREFRSVRGLFLEFTISSRFLQTRDQSNLALADEAFEDAFVLSFGPRVTWDRRDNPLNPRKGTFHQVEMEFADDFFGVFDASRFTRITTRNSGYLPLGSDLVLAANIRLGFALGGVLRGFQDERAYSLPLAERYALGGITSLRGFDDNAVRPDDALEFGGDAVINTTVELRYPFVRSIGLEGAVFADVGQLSQGLTDFRLDGFRFSAGMGLRLILLDLIPVLFDYATVIDRRPGENAGRFHFNVGYTF
jgi:outer membrane protein insertion porin family